jgi:serine/threonine protein kinase
MAHDPNQKDGTQGFWTSPADPAPAPQELRPGFKLKDRYLIDRELGRGGIGVVYLARDERLHGMPVVIKFLLDNSDQNAWLARKFLQEAEALTRINHPGVVRVIDKDRTDDGRPFFVMEFVNGKPLRAVMNEGGMDFKYTAHLVRQIGHALSAAHHEGILHRDLKPENIMLQTLSDDDAHVKLIDFGIARVRNSQVGATTDIPVIAGSLQYITPEQLSGDEVSAATDIYSFGIIVYEMVTGRRPFNADAPSQLASMQQLLQMQQTETLVPPKQLRPSLTAAAQAIILRALTYEPSHRPQDARTFGDELARALMGSQTVDQPTVIAATPPADPQASFKITPPVTLANSRQETQRGLGETHREIPRLVEPGAPGKSNLLWVAIGLVVVAAFVAVGLFGKKLWSSSAIEKNPAIVAPQPSTPEAERVLNYSVTVQKDPSRYPGSKPFQLPGEVIFSPGDRVRFTFSSPQSGYLYLINESPTQANGPTSFNVLFPSPTSNNASAQLAADQQIRIPERGDGFIFDAEQGTEKLWLVWSASAIAELEALKRWANPQDKGEIKDLAEAARLRAFLTPRALSKLDVEKNDANKQTIIKGKGDVLTKLVNLEHH